MDLPLSLTLAWGAWAVCFVALLARSARKAWASRVEPLPAPRPRPVLVKKPLRGVHKPAPYGQPDVMDLLPHTSARKPLRQGSRDFITALDAEQQQRVAEPAEEHVAV